LNPNSKKIEKIIQMNVAYVAVYYIFAMMVKVGKIGSKFENPFLG
jgi:hypothetical protein